jgi:hypothetical protein
METQNPPQAWLVICLLCAFMAVINLTLISLWHHRHERPSSKNLPPTLSWPKAPWSEENAQWKRLRETVKNLPQSTPSEVTKQQIEQEFTNDSQLHPPEE